MEARKRTVALAALLGVLCGAVTTAGVTMAMDDDPVVSVESQVPEPQTREDYVREWEAALAKSGKRLPPKAEIDGMTDHEIFEAMWAELEKHAEPAEMPVEVVD